MTSGPFLALIASLVLSSRLARYAFCLQALDHPNTRSLHRKPIPRTGGLAVLGGILAGMSITLLGIANPPIRVSGFMFVGLVPLALVSFQDDRMGVHAKWRILVHLLAAVSLLAAGLMPGSLVLPGFALPLPAWFAIPPTILFAIWMINLYNFMDGMDGFASGMAVIGFSALAWLGWVDTGFASFCLIVAAASTGFLVHNFPPAKIFLGDTGSTVLGFLAAAFSLWGAQAGLFPFWVALLVFSPFHCRRHRDPVASPAAWGESLGGAPEPLLPAAGVARLGPSPYRVG